MPYKRYIFNVLIIIITAWLTHDPSGSWVSYVTDTKAMTKSTKVDFSPYPISNTIV